MNHRHLLFAGLAAAILIAGCATTHSGVVAQARTDPVATPPGNDDISAPDPAMPMPEPVPPIAQPGKVTEPDPEKRGEIDWGTGMIRAAGRAAIDPANTNRAQAMLMAERAATVDAQRKLLEITRGVRVNGETVVEDLMLKSDFVVSRVDGIVRGARPIGRTEYDTLRGMVAVELGMQLYGEEGVSEAIQPAPPAGAVPDAPPSAKVQQLLAKYSAIVVEGAGSNAKPALFPRLFDPQGNLLLDTRELMGGTGQFGRGVIQFVESADQVLTNPELARNPLVIKIRQAQGRYLSDYVIPREQSELLKTVKAAVPYLLKLGRFLLALI